MKALLNYLFEHKTLTKEQAKNAVIEIGEGKHSVSQIASFLTVFCMRSLTVEELEGFRDAMLELCIKIDLSDFNAIDIVGTGGDGKDTFNISTLSSFVTAGAGVKVSKHGNYGVSSSCGSSNVLEYLGVPFTNEEAKLQDMLDKAGFCMMHAPLFHPAMKHVAPVRKEMQVRTFFNILGPLVNPSFPKNQLLGVFNLELARLYGYLHQNTDKNYAIVHALDGYDEISLTSSTKVISNKGEALLTPKDFGFAQNQQSDLFGGASVESSAKIFVDILEGKGTPQQNSAILANAGLAIQTVNQGTLEDGIAQAKESLESGKALNVLKTLQAL
ncbi:MAG: anthranilate phosphoribosyltransferase [Cytophagales bacterium]|nr:anthranilate phosphoribosyltransferase [Cytophagales bacterium]